MYQNFTDKLMEAKRRARLMGRPLHRSEVAGISAGYAKTASERLARRKQLSLQERSLDIQERGQEEEIRIAEQARKQEKHEARGAAIGAGIGTLIMPGLGTAIGGMLGSTIGGGCIIISACTDPDSYEVNIAREYRDNYMSLEELIGYYTLARLVVPIMPKKLVKRFLVDRLIDYGEVILQRKKRLKFASSYWITTGFLKLCEGIGSLYIWRRMEVYDG